VELTTDIVRTCFFTFYWILLINIHLPTHTLLKEQGVLYSRPTAIFPS